MNFANNSIVQLIFICLAFYTTDLVGRRPLLLGALVVVSIVNLSIGICGLYLDRSATQNGVIVLACIWITAYASGIAPIGMSPSEATTDPKARPTRARLRQSFSEQRPTVSARPAASSGA